MDPWHPNTQILLEAIRKMPIESLRNSVKDVNSHFATTHALGRVYSLFDYYRAGEGSQSLYDDIYA
jgi:hypothetical protein